SAPHLCLCVRPRLLPTAGRSKYIFSAAHPKGVREACHLGWMRLRGNRCDSRGAEIREFPLSQPLSRSNINRYRYSSVHSTPPLSLSKLAKLTAVSVPWGAPCEKLRTNDRSP